MNENIEKSKMLLEGVELTEIKSDDDIYTIQKFKEACESGWLTEDDGCGTYSFSDLKSNIFIDFFDILNDSWDKRFTHIV